MVSFVRSQPSKLKDSPKSVTLAGMVTDSREIQPLKTAFSAGGTALTTALCSAPAVYASGLSSQDSTLLKKEKDLMMSVAKDVFGKVPGFGYFTFAFDTILDLTDAFGTGGSDSDGISSEDLQELREHLDEELNEIKAEMARLGIDLTNEIKMTFYAGNLGLELLDMHTTASMNASNIVRYKNSPDYPTENDKLVMVASLIGNTNDWGNTKNLVYRMYQIGLMLKGTTYSDLDGKSLYNKVYDYYASKSLFSSEVYDKAVPYIDSIVYEYLYAYAVQLPKGRQSCFTVFKLPLQCREQPLYLPQQRHDKKGGQAFTGQL